MKTLVNKYLGYNEKPPDIIYHYCSTEAFLSIIENNCIWLSDISKTNDSTEMQWLFSNVKSAVSNTLSQLEDKVSLAVRLQVELLINQLINGYLISKSIPITESEKNFLTCFSEESNLLSQWRAYGNDGKGVSIGFSSNYFMRFENHESYEFVKVTYKQKDIKSFLKSTIEIPLKELLLSNESHRDDVTLNLNIALLLHSIYQEGFVFKNPHFSEEKEWRLFRRVNHTNFSTSDGIDEYGFSSSLEGIFLDNTKYVGGFTRNKLRFRSTDTDLRLYMELGFEEFKKHIIKSIILGPKCGISQLDLELLLIENGYMDDLGDESIKIIKSEIPYI